MMSEVKNISKSHLEEAASTDNPQEFAVDSVHINKKKYPQMFFVFYGEDGRVVPKETAWK